MVQGGEKNSRGAAGPSTSRAYGPGAKNIFATVYKSNNTGYEAESWLPEAKVVWKLRLLCCGELYSIFLKNNVFLGIFWSIFLLKRTVLICTVKCVDTLAQECMPPLVPCQPTGLN